MKHVRNLVTYFYSPPTKGRVCWFWSVHPICWSLVVRWFTMKLQFHYNANLLKWISNYINYGLDHETSYVIQVITKSCSRKTYMGPREWQLKFATIGGCKIFNIVINRLKIMQDWKSLLWVVTMFLKCYCVCLNGTARSLCISWRDMICNILMYTLFFRWGHYVLIKVELTWL